MDNIASSPCWGGHRAEEKLIMCFLLSLGLNYSILIYG